MLKNFHLKACEGFIWHAGKEVNNQNGWSEGMIFLCFMVKQYWMVDSTLVYEPMQNRMPVDIFFSKSPIRIRIASIVAAVRPSMVVLMLPTVCEKLQKWKKE